MKPTERIPIHAYRTDPFTFAYDTLLGASIYTNISDQLTGGVITEVEVYPGGNDRGSHTYQNKKTNRTQVIFEPGGVSYVYLIYGMYYQFCTVTGQKDDPSAVLIRAIEPTVGIDIMQERRSITDITNLTTGPGKMCKALGIDKALYGAKLTGELIWLTPKPANNITCVKQTRRTGIDVVQ